MKKIIAAIFTLILFILCAQAVCPAEAPTERQGNTDDMISRALKGQEDIFARRYQDAEKAFDSLLADYPDSPAGDFGKMALLEVKMLEREDFHLEKEFIEASRAGQKKVGQIMQRYHPAIWDIFLSGSLVGLDGFFKARKGQWWDAYVQGNRSRQLFKRVKQMDPSFVDADFGLGMYIYWRSVFTRDLWFLKMFPDRRNEGIAIVENVAKQGRFAKDLARVNLVIMYLEEKRYADARNILDEYAAHYPSNVVLKRLYGKVLIAQHQYDAAIKQFEGILSIDPQITQPHYFIGASLILKADPSGFDRAEKELQTFMQLEKGRYWPAHAHYWMGRLMELRGDKDRAQAEYKAALDLDPKIKDAVTRMRGLGGGV